MTNFNHTAIAKDVFRQAEDILHSGGWTNNEAMLFRMMVAHKFIKAQIKYLTNDDAELWSTIINLYKAALTHTTDFGKRVMQAVGEEAFAKPTKLACATIKLMANELEGGSAGDMDLVWREQSQLQLFALYTHVKNAAGKEAAEMIVEMNNALTTAVNLELELVDRMCAA